MITEGRHEFTRSYDDRKSRCNSEIRSKVKDLNDGNRTDAHKEWQITQQLLSDDGYYSLANIGGKNNRNFLLPPTNSWPLRRKIGAKEFKEYGDRLDSGSDSYIEAKGNNTASRNSFDSSPASAARIELETASVLTEESKCTASAVRDCIDYCTCMLCVKSAYYVCCDADDDTGTEPYDPCFCSKPSWGCVKRWSCLGILSCFVPCMLCYPVAKGCVSRYEGCKRTKDKAARKRFKIRFTKNGNREQTRS